MIVIVDYGLGNLNSIANMLRKIGAEAMISGNPTAILAAEKLILPGVGAFDHGMRNLRESGLVEPLTYAVRERNVPVLGLCLGMQLMVRGSEEGRSPGLGWIDAEAVRFRQVHGDVQVRIPHMGWNIMRGSRPSVLTKDLGDDPRFYFVHSYHLVCADEKDVLGRTFHGYEFAAAVEKDNMFGVQFHPEKSHRFGMQLLKNFESSVSTPARAVAN